MDLQDLDRIGFVTRYFQELQGLRNLVPMGLMFLVQGFVPILNRLPTALGWLCLAGVFSAAMLLMFGSKRFYRRLLGEVEARRHQTTVSEWLPVLLLVAVAGVYLLATGAASSPRMVGLSFGSVLLGHWLRREMRGSQVHLLLLGGLLTGVAVLAPVGSWLAAMGGISTLAGTCWILAGLLDHRQLIQILGHLPAPSLEEDAAAETAARR